MIELVFPNCQLLFIASTSVILTNEKEEKFIAQLSNNGVWQRCNPFTQCQSVSTFESEV